MTKEELIARLKDILKDSDYFIVKRLQYLIDDLEEEVSK